MIILSRSQYRLEERGGIFIVIATATLLCPVCGGMLSLLCRRLRGAISPNGNKVLYMIRRMRCAGCGKIHHELPDCLVPYKRHCAETIENIIADNTECAPCEPGFVRRIKAWWSAVAAYFTNILSSFAARLGMKPPERPAFKDIIRAAANSNSWTFPGRLPGAAS